MSSGDWITDQKKDEILRKLEPYLKSGLTVHKACLEAKIPDSTVSDLMKDEKFAEKIKTFQQYLSVLTANAFYNLLVKLIKKMTGVKNPDGTWKEEPQDLSKNELELLKWHSTKSKITREEYGDRQEVEVINPQERLKKINELLDEKFGK